MTRRGAVRKPRVTADLCARRCRRRKARMFRTCTFSNGADFTRLMRKCRKSLPRADLRALRYRRRKARKFRTWTFSAGAFFAREVRKGRRGNCYAEVAKHASYARKVFPETGILRPGCVPGSLRPAPPAPDRRPDGRRKTGDDPIAGSDAAANSSRFPRNRLSPPGSKVTWKRDS